MPVKDRAALDAITLGRTKLVTREPFFGCLSMMLELVEVNDKAQCGTMAVDGRHLFYNPEFTNALGEDEIKGVLAHEVMHCALRHMSRRGHRDPKISNIATDFVINLMIIEAGFKLMGKPISVDDLKKCKTLNSTENDRGYLYDTQFANMGWEEVYEILMSKHVTKIRLEVMGEDPGGCGAVRDAKGTANPEQGNKDKNGKGASPGEIDALETEWEGHVRMALNTAKRQNAGNIPSHLKRLVEELDKPRINWRDQLQDFVTASMTKDYSWSRPNRRSVACGVLLPGYIPDSIAHLVGVFDCSGSITEDLMRIYASELQSILDDVCDRITIIYTDTEVKKVDEFLRGDLIKVETPGGGGTCFDAVMEYIPRQCEDAACVVFLTDMLTLSFGQDPEIPVLWGATLPYAALKEINPPFGRVIQVDGSE